MYFYLDIPIFFRYSVDILYQIDIYIYRQLQTDALVSFGEVGGVVGSVVHPLRVAELLAVVHVQAARAAAESVTLRPELAAVARLQFWM